MTWRAQLLTGFALTLALLTIVLRADDRLAPSDAVPPVMFTIDFCPACLAAKRWFDQCNIDVLEFNLDHSEEAKMRFKQVAGRGIPLVLWQGQRMNGFHPERIPAAFTTWCESGVSDH